MNTGLLLPSVIFCPFHCLEMAYTHLCLKKDNLRHYILTSLKFARERDYNETGRIFLYTQYFINLPTQVFWINVLNNGIPSTFSTCHG